MPSRAENQARWIASNGARETSVRTHYSRQMTAAARAIAAMKFLMLRSKRGGYTAPVLEAAKTCAR